MKNFFLEPFWYTEYEKIFTEYYSRLDYFKKHASNEFTEEERKEESDQLNILHGFLNKIRLQYESYFCSHYKEFENLFDLSKKQKHHHHHQIPINNNDDEIGYEINLITL